MTLLALSFSAATPEVLLDAIVRADAAGVGLVLIDYGTPETPVDPLALAAVAAAATRKIRLSAAIMPAIVEPFTFARGLSALDHFSNGRAAWRVVGEAVPFGASAPAAQQTEFTGVVGALCESWDADALVDDKDEAQFWRAGSVRPINHVGEFYQVAGPLSTPRPPQGIPARVAVDGDAALAGAQIVVVQPGATAPDGAIALVDVSTLAAGDAPAAAGYHARIDPADEAALAAFVARFSGVDA